MSYLQTEPVFRDTVCMLDRSTIPGEFFAWTVHPRYAYKPVFEGATRCAYWQSLFSLLHELETDEAFAIEPSTQPITTFFSQSEMNQEAANA
jgi:hypothetical protein